MRISTILLSLLLSIFVLSCGTSEPGPKEVAEQYFMLLNNKEFDKAKDLCTDETKDLIEKFEFFKNDEGSVETADIVVEDLKCVIDGDKAVCTFIADGEKNEMVLKKVNGKWLIDFDIEQAEPTIEESDLEETMTDTIISGDMAEEAAE